MKIAFVSNLFPDTSEPYRGLDNAVLLKELSRKCEVRVISPRPVLPWKTFTKKEPRPVDERFQPVYPRTFYVPKIGSRFNHLLFANAIREPLQSLKAKFPFDTILCSWAYPDGCAVARVAGEMKTPFTLIAQGSDVHAYLQNPVRRRLIVEAANQSGGMITRSGKLAELLGDAGVAKEKLHPIYNGVDLETFCPGNREEARRQLGLPLDAKIVLFVGNFYEVKNPLLLVRAHAALCQLEPDRKIQLVMIGAGHLSREARREADAGSFGNAVSLAGRRQPEEIARFMQAADLLCVPSDNEGVPNVILEAFACGLPVVSTRVGGIHEVLTENFLGRLVEKQNLPGLVSALQLALSNPAESSLIRNHALQFSWERTAAAYLKVLGR